MLSSSSAKGESALACEATAYARAGLIGNPSDGYYGKTISFSVRNFFAKVSLYDDTEVELVPSVRDRSRYRSIDELVEDVDAYGYYGGIRLMKATVRQFVGYCREHGIPLHSRNFSMRYRSTIPRHVGLAGSSALVTAAMRCLMEFYEVEIPKPKLPNLILSVEIDQLGISAGLQDRVIQVYEGCVYMDFDQEYMEANGHGQYESIEPELLPKLFIAYRTDFSVGSQVTHNRIRERWLNGDQEVVQAMHDFASYADEVRALLIEGKGSEIGPVLDKNFDRRCSICAISPADRKMIDIGRSLGASCKFSGSGGAIVGLYDDDEMFEALHKAYEDSGIRILRPQITDY
jgi:glucuronokinase